MAAASSDSNTAVQTFEPNTEPSTDPSKDDKQIIVIGGGPVGIRFAQELLERNPLAKVTVFGNEPYAPYNRVQLSSLLAGDVGYDDITTNLPAPNLNPNFRYEVRTVREINTEFQTVSDNLGERFVYDTLVIATGSRPHVPSIPGVEQSGVYTFRNLKDTEHLYARRSRSRQTVVVGGGLLGLEAARAMATLNTAVTVVQQGERLMNRQLDQKAAALLEADVKALGVEVITQDGVREIHGREGRVTSVTLRDGVTIECDTVLICAGIKANLEIARNAKIKVGRGILVDDTLTTSAPNVYAIGECCEHRGLVYGLVNPGFEQAAILADILSGGQSHYLGSLEVSRLKVVGANVHSMGEIDELPKRPFLRQLTYVNKKQNSYRKLTIHRGKVIGAVAYGEWIEARRIQEAYQQGRRIWPWQQLKFLLTGFVWGEGASNDPRLWPSTAIICQCNNISQGQLLSAINSGANSATALTSKTGAGSVCGSCKPLLAQMLGSKEKQEKEKAWLPALLASVIAALLVTFVGLTPGMQISDSVQTIGAYESIWNDKFWKQVTGFTLLGLSVIGLLMSLRKRINIKRLGEFAYWRLLHIFLGLACAGILILHTGLHLGANLNRLLMFNFIAVVCIGALAGAAVSLSHTLKPSSAMGLRKFFTWSHILITWPLPILLGIHILTVYYF